jgi:hypothetical protein
MRHRLHALCSYFAMFPEAFAEQWLAKLSKPGDLVLDPFCGRGTLPFQALLMDRRAIGCDTNPVAYCISKAKTNVPSQWRVLRRIQELEESFGRRTVRREVEQLPTFFRYAYDADTLHQIVFLRSQLRHRISLVDGMIAALVLGSLHGEADKSDRFLSNQMPHTISTKPEYSIRFWRKRRQRAPKRDAFELLRRQAEYRYESAPPKERGLILHTDMRELPRFAERFEGPVRCVVTSPPYFDVTNYAEDQWLRVWFLGGPPEPKKQEFSRDDRHGNIDQYWIMLADMWRALSLVLDKNANVVIRLGATRIRPERLVAGLEGVAKVANRRIRLVDSCVSEIVKRQTESFRPGSKGCRVEVDCHFHIT